MDAPTRASRWTREEPLERGASKRLQITKRDLEIFKLLQRYRYLPTDYIHAFIGGDKNRFQKRLGRLYREPNCFINRPGQQRNSFDANYRSLVYELDRAGEHVLSQYGFYDPTEAVALLNTRREEGRKNFPHSLMICMALASVELGVRADPSLRFISWKEIQSGMPDTVRNSALSHDLPAHIEYRFDDGKLHKSDMAVRPDAVFGIEKTGLGKCYFALECDRDNMPVVRSNLEQTSYLRKILQYQDVIKNRTYKTHWGLRNLIVLNLTTNEFHKNKILELVSDLTEGKGATYFAFRSTPSLGDFDKPPPADGHLLTSPWQRAGHPDFLIPD